MSKSNLPSRVMNSRLSNLPKLSPPQHGQFNQNNARQFSRNPSHTNRPVEYLPHEQNQVKSYHNYVGASNNITHHVPVSKIPINSGQVKSNQIQIPSHTPKEISSGNIPGNDPSKYNSNLQKVSQVHDNYNIKDKLHRNYSSGAHYKSVLDLQKISDEELFKHGTYELIKRIRKMEVEVKSMMAEHNALVSDLNKRVHHYEMEMQYLKDLNQKLQDDNQELRDLCCFLDDDRQKGRKLAREWQRFGRYTASVMRQEVSAYQNKLKDLDGKQQDLIRDNLELKELCLYLDEERNHVNQLCHHCNVALTQGQRDDGDGSSSSTNPDETVSNIHYQPNANSNNYRTSGSVTHSSVVRSASHERLLEESIQRQRNTFNEQILQYIRSLEQKVLRLEEEKQIGGGSRNTDTDMTEANNRLITEDINETMSSINADSEASFETRPPGVVDAMKVLQVHEQLVGGDTEMEEDFGEKERALVREMCNVVWRKLEICSNTK